MALDAPNLNSPYDVLMDEYDVLTPEERAIAEKRAAREVFSPRPLEKVSFDLFMAWRNTPGGRVIVSQGKPKVGAWAVEKEESNRKKKR